MPETPYYDLQRGDYLPLPQALPERYHAALPALALYTARTLHREHPAGTRDAAGRWYPATTEARACCRRLRPPSRRFPHALSDHCRTAGHCAQLVGVPQALLRGLLASIVRYWRNVGDAPWLCPVCGASWHCEHAPGSESEQAGMYRIPEDRGDMDRHLREPAARWTLAA